MNAKISSASVAVDAGRLDRAVDELLAVDRDLVLLLLPHDLAQLVGFAHREAGDVARDLHDLLLVARDAVGFGTESARVWDAGTSALRAAVFDRDVLRNPLHRARPVERDERDDVVEARRAAARRRRASCRRIRAGRRRSFRRGRASRTSCDRRRGIFARSNVPSTVRRISSTAFFITVRLRSPRKSILSRPIFSTHSMSYCVLTSPSPKLDQRRVVDQRALRDHDAGRVRAGVARQPFDRLWRCRAACESAGASRTATFSSGICSSASVDRQPARPDGISFATRSTSGSGTPSARPASRTAARAAIVPNVTICATRSLPYFSVT